MLTPQEVRDLGDHICDFLEECGGPYEKLHSEVIYNVFWSLGAGHYVWDPGRYFACYWCVQPEDVADVRNRVKPLDITHGSVMYVAEAASKVGLGEVVRRLRAQAVGMAGLFWHRPTKADRVYNFPSQRGAENGITG